MGKQNGLKFPVWLAWVAVVSAILVIAAGSVHFVSTQRQQQKMTHDRLTSVARMKSVHIQQWHRELRRDASDFAKTIGLVSYYKSYLTTKSPEAKSQVMARLSRRQTNWHMTRIMLVDTHGSYQIGTTAKPVSIPPEIKPIVSEVLSRSSVVLSDIVPSPKGGAPLLFVVAPVTAQDNRTVLGAVICCFNANTELDYIMHFWPDNSPSAETLLVKKYGNSAIILHNTRFRSSSSTGHEWPITDKSVPSSEAVNGHDGVVEGTDYRSRSVLSVTMKVPDTNWFLASKIDRPETAGYKRGDLVLAIAVIAFLLLLIAAVTLAVWQNIKSDHYKQAYEAEHQQQALAQHYQSLIKNASDMILLTDTDMHILEVNDLALQVYGYSRNDMLKMDIYDLVAPEEQEASHNRAEQLKATDILTFNSQHRTQTGELMYVEGRARKIDTDGIQYIQLIMRDTTQKMKQQLQLERNENLLIQLMNHLPGMAYVLNKQGKFVYMNQALAEFLGVVCTSPDSWSTIDHPLLPHLQCNEDQKRELARYHSISTEIQLENGSSYKHFLLGNFNVRQPDGQNWLGGIMLDISQSKHSELALQRLTLIYAVLSQINEVISKATDTYGLYQTVCDVAAEYGKSSLAWIGSYDEHVSTLAPLARSGSPQEYVNIVTAPSSGLMHDIDPVFSAIRTKKAVYANNIATGAYSPGETLLHSQNIHSAAAVPILENNSVIGVLALYQQEPEFFGEQELQLLDKIGLNISYGLDSIKKRQQQHQLEEIVVNSPAVAFRWMNSKGWPVLYTSDNITQLGIRSDYFSSELTPYTSVIHPDDIRMVEDTFAQYLANPSGVYTRTYRIVDHAGATRWVEERSWLVDDDTDHHQYVMGIVMDITQQKLVEQNQQDSEQRYHAVFNNLHTVMLVVDPSTGSIVDANPAAVEFYGWPKQQLLSMSMSSINTLPADQLAEAMAKVMSQTQTHFRLMHRRANGKISDVEVYSTSIVVQGQPLLYSIIHDVTDRVTAEEMRQREEQRQVQSSKMETIGQLSSGIAHDFNNLLTVITGFVDIMMAESSESSPLYSEMIEVKNASNKAASLTKQLLAFSRKQTLERKPVDVNVLITSNKNMIGRLIGEDIKVDMTLASGLLMASVDEGQLDQVLLNLATNARDAMPNGGNLRIITDVVTITKDDVSFGNEASEGRFIKITIADTGTGMDEATSSRIFEPFYTTKEAGKGTGLGLSTCYGIMKQHEGWISVSSTKGAGTEFYLYLPVLDVAQDSSKHITPAASLPQGDGHTVLLVEDEQAVQRMSIKVLERFGYVVIPASDGVEALSIYQNEPSRFDLVLSDVVMPNMDGLTLINHIQDINPTQKIILNSGYTDDKVDWGSIENRNITFLHKPFTVERLITTVHQVITGS